MVTMRAQLTGFKGVIGIPTGIFAGILVASLLVVGYEDLGQRARVPVDTAAGLGYGIGVAHLTLSVVLHPATGSPADEIYIGLVLLGGVIGGVASVVTATRQVDLSPRTTG